MVPGGQIGCGVGVQARGCIPMKKLRLFVLVFFAFALLACGEAASDKPAATAMPELAALTVQPESAPRERIWDGVVEAVNQATLSAQTGGRVLALPYDVNDTSDARREGNRRVTTCRP